ncbi:MAG: hypothetical protein LBR64_08750 [Dysgonamonadaceae bacterium]|jgi:hypothetical protein|nr:hypothetical protein [Dysgonamonadaceae bacterium]
MANLGYGFCPTHPGELLKEEIEYRKLSGRIKLLPTASHIFGGLWRYFD